MAAPDHRAAAPASVVCVVLTVSDTRTAETDTSGGAIASLFHSAGHVVGGRALVRDEPEQIRRALTDAIGRDDVDAVLVTGGTGITSRDRTIEVVNALLDKRLDGFGELFRMLSYDAIGPAAMLSRAIAGLAHGRIVIAMPGSENAVRLAMEKLVLPELGHLVREARR